MSPTSGRVLTSRWDGFPSVVVGVRRLVGGRRPVGDRWVEIRRGNRGLRSVPEWLAQKSGKGCNTIMGIRIEV